MEWEIKVLRSNAPLALKVFLTTSSTMKDIESNIQHDEAPKIDDPII